MKKISTKSIAFIGICAALIAVCSWISVPFIVPFTMQTFAVFFALAFLGGKMGLASIVLYMAIGAVGLPVFSEFRGGVGHLFGPTGGYIIGFIASGVLFIFLEKIPSRGKLAVTLKLILSLIPCYLFGTVWFYAAYGSANAVSFWGCLLKCVIPFIVPDIVKISLAYLVSDRLKSALGSILNT